MARKMLRVLIADDERIARENMSQYIPWTSLGMEVVDAVENGALALDILKTVPVDIMIVDIRMPVMDGLELLENIRSLGLKVLVIVLSAYDRFEYAQKAIQSQLVFEYVLKPIKRQDICQLLQKARKTLEMQDGEAEDEVEPDSLEVLRTRASNHIHNRDLDGTIELLETYAQGVSLENKDELFNLKRLLMNLHTEIRLQLAKEGINYSTYRLDYDLLNDFNQCDQPTEMVRRFFQLAEEMRPYLEQFAEAGTPTKTKAVARHCIEEIQKHYTEAGFSLYQLAEEMKLSTNYLSTLLKKEIGMGYVRYINTLRIEKAKQLLRDMRYRTSEVAMLVGIENPRYFAKVFKEMTGISPAEYRSRMKVHSDK